MQTCKNVEQYSILHSVQVWCAKEGFYSLEYKTPSFALTHTPLPL